MIHIITEYGLIWHTAYGTINGEYVIFRSFSKKKIEKWVNDIFNRD